MGIYQRIADTAGERENRFMQKCEDVEAYFAYALVSLDADLSTHERAKDAADRLEIKLTEMDAVLEKFLNTALGRPHYLDKLAQKTGLTIKHNSLMTVARAATLPPKEKDK